MRNITDQEIEQITGGFIRPKDIYEKIKEFLDKLNEQDSGCGSND